MIEGIAIGLIGLITFGFIVQRIYRLYKSLRHPTPDCTLCEGCRLRESCAQKTPPKVDDKASVAKQ